MMTPKEYAENLINQFDMIIYTDQDHYNQVLRCAKKAMELKILTLESIENAEEVCTYFENVLKEIESRL